MRILFCNYEYPPLGGGGGVVCAQVAEELASRNDVTVLTSLGPGLPKERFENGVRVIRVPVFFRKKMATANLLSMLAFLPMATRAGKRLLSAERFDVINTHFVLPSGPVGDALARFSGVPNVLTVHGGDLYDPSKLASPHRHPALRAWVRRLLDRADKVVGQSTNTLANAGRFYSRDVRYTLIPLGIRRPELRPVPRAIYGFGEDEILLVTVGRLIRRKAVDQLIRVLQSLEDDRVRLVVIGSGPQEAQLAEEARKRGVLDQVRFMGYVDDDEKFQLLAMSDIYVSTTQHEGFGLVFLEAMHCGLPIICYDHGGQTDFLRDGLTGYLVPLNNMAWFVDRCRSLLASPDRRQAIAAHNQRAVRDYYIDRCAQRYEDTFREVVSGAVAE